MFGENAYCIDTTFFLHFFCLYNTTYSTPVTSTNLRNQAPLFTELHLLQGTPFHFPDKETSQLIFGIQIGRTLTNATPKILRTVPKIPILHKKSLNLWWCSDSSI